MTLKVTDKIPVRSAILVTAGLLVRFVSVQYRSVALYAP